MESSLLPKSYFQQNLPPSTLERLEAAAFRSLCQHLQDRSDDVQNLDLMSLSGFCRNCLAKWMVLEARKLVDEGTITDPDTVNALNRAGYDEAAEHVYGINYSDWKKRHQKKATEEQMQKYEASKNLHAVHDKKLLATRITDPAVAQPTLQSKPPLSNVCCQDVESLLPPNRVADPSQTAPVHSFVPPPIPDDQPKLQLAVLTVSDRASSGVYQDVSGPAIVDATKSIYGRIESAVVVVPDEVEAVQEKLHEFSKAGFHLVLTTGGTGWSPRDVTPEATRAVLDQECTGLMAFVAIECTKKQPLACMSRGTAGMLGDTMIANLPGNPQAIEEIMPILFPILLNIVKDLHKQSQ